MGKGMMSGIWKTSVVLVALMVVGCGGTSTGGGGPTPDIEATVEAKLWATITAERTTTAVPTATAAVEKWVSR